MRFFVDWVKCHKFLLQTLLSCLIVGIPGNIVTFVMYHRVYSSGSTNATSAMLNFTCYDFTCYESREASRKWLDNVNFWIKSVGPAIIGSFGLIGNVLSVVVFQRLTASSRLKLAASFNRLLLALGNKKHWPWQWPASH